MTSLRKLGTALMICLTVLMFAPFSTLAEEPTIGTIIVSVVDETGETISGNWYLHRGSTEGGFLVRNGSFSEKFQMDAGNYYLEVRGQVSSHPYYLVHSDNPQYLYGGSSITFNVQYFETQEQKLAASGNAPAAQSPELAGTTSQLSDDIFDEHGCNSTQGYTWCAKDESCIKFWSPACRIVTSETVAEPESEVAAEPDVAEEPAVSTVPAVSEDSGANDSGVPTFDMAPTPIEPQDLNTAIEADSGMRLVQTGSSAGLLLIASMLLSLGMLRRSYTRRQRP